MHVNSNSDAGKEPVTGQPYLKTIAASYEHVPSLDGLRAISIAAVLFTHFVAPHGPGGYGVFLFFIISGFLITRLLFAEQNRREISIKDFYLRRFFRLYPVLVVFTLFAVTVSYFRYGHFSLDEAFAALFYYANFLIVHKELTGQPLDFEAFQVFWSLSVEEHFYLFFPVIFFFLKKAERVAILAIVVIVACTAARYLMASAHPELIGTHYFGMLTQYRIDSIALGVLLAAMCEIPAGQRIVMLADRYWMLALAFVVLAAGFILIRDPALKTALRWPMLGFPILVMIAAVVFSPRHRLAIAALNHPAAVWTGKLSYSLYVWHTLAGYAAHDLLANPVLATAGAVFFSYLFAALSYFLIEQPMIRAGKRMRKKTGPHVPPGGPAEATLAG